MPDDIRYCTTHDGVNIAFTVRGSRDRWLIHPPNGFSAAIQFREIPGRADWIDAMGDQFTLVEYDSRGTGFSQRDHVRFSTDALIADMEAVIEAAGVPEQFLMLGTLAGAFAGALYAAKHPERVERLAIWPPPLIEFSADSPMAKLAVTDWETFTEMYAHVAFGWSRGEPAHRFAQVMRQTIKQETFVRTFVGWAREGYEPAFERMRAVRAPTLIVQREGYSDLARIAPLIPGAKVSLVPGDSAAPYLEHPERSLDLILEFFGGAPAERTSAEVASPAASGTAVILFTDIADSTPLTERMGDAAFRAASGALEAAVRDAMRAAGGAPVEGRVLGDGVMAVFSSAAQAIDAARQCVAISAESELRLHIGLHAGDVIREGGNVYGGAVNIASRICGLCAPGEILVSQTVRDLARTSAGVSFEDRGEQVLKGVGDAVRVFAIA